MKRPARRPAGRALVLACALPAFAGAQAGIVDEASAELELRNFYINQDQRSGDPDYSRAEEWGQGFILDLESGYTPGRVGFGLDLLGQFGLRLDSGGRADKPGITREPGDVFPLSGDQAAGHFGRLDPTLKARAFESVLKAGALEPDLPILMRNDSRLLPQTFRGAHLSSEMVANAELHLGQVSSVNQRNSTDYENMRIRGGDAGSDRLRFVGVRYQPADGTQIGYFAAELRDYYLQHFAGLKHDVDWGAGELGIDLRAFHSSGRGANAEGDSDYAARGAYAGGEDAGEIDNQTFSVGVDYELGNQTFAVGHQWVNGNSDFPYVDNGDGASIYLITYAQLGKFQRAGERTWVAEYSYAFDDVGLAGLEFSGAYLRGRGIRSADGRDSREWERDLRVDYQPVAGPLQNMKITLRHASLRSGFADQRDVDEARIILSYTWDLL